MFGSTILDVAIGVVFIFLLVSIIASAIREGLEAYLKTRASHLEAGLREILKDPQGTGLVKNFYDHPLIYSLYAGTYEAKPNIRPGGLLFAKGNNLPSYIPSRSFALTLMDMAARGPQLPAGHGGAHPVTMEAIRDNLGTIENAAVQRALLIALDRADGDLQKAQANLEAWYDSAMDRVSGWYKRSSQIILLVVGLLLAVGLNINILKIGDTLYHDNTLRQLVVSTAEKNQGQPLTYDGAKQQLGNSNLPIGWPADWPAIGVELQAHWPSDVAGWLLTAFAVSIGAPFWFDLLNRLIVIRSTVKPHQKSPEEASSDHQEPIPAPVSAPEPRPMTQAVATATASPATLAMVILPDPDGCDVDKTKDLTTDEMLPAAAGGVL